MEGNLKLLNFILKQNDFEVKKRFEKLNVLKNKTFWKIKPSEEKDSLKNKKVFENKTLMKKKSFDKCFVKVTLWQRFVYEECSIILPKNC